MIAADLALGLRLKQSAGWNQTAADWRMLLDATDARNFVARYEGKDVGCVTVLPFERRFSWIGMLLVDPAFSRRGIGRALLLASLEASVGVARLDATPAGRKLYDTLGFDEEYTLARWTCTAVPALSPADCAVPPSGLRLHPPKPDGLAAIAAYDRVIFGADRIRILDAFRSAAPKTAWVAVDGDGRVRGYAMGRPGANFAQIGPIMADDAQIADALLDSALTTLVGQPVAVDADDRHADFLARLAVRGFVRQRPFIRMTRGAGERFGDPRRQFAIAGPELG